MAEYIDRDEFRKRLIDRQITTAFFNPQQRHEIGCIVEMLDNMPAADVAEVVRCKDCANYSDFDPYAGKRFNFHFCRKFHNVTLESDFCSYGEKKNGKEKDHE